MAKAQNKAKYQEYGEEEELNHSNTITVGEDAWGVQHFFYDFVFSFLGDEMLFNSFSEVQRLSEKVCQSLLKAKKAVRIMKLF